MVSRKQTSGSEKGKKKRDENGMTTDANHVTGDERNTKIQAIQSPNTASASDKRSRQVQKPDQSTSCCKDGTDDNKEVLYPTTRSSTRVTKRPRRDLSPPASPPRKQAKEVKAEDGKSVTPETKTRRPWELWSTEDKSMFFEGLYEFGKDFDAIQNLIVQRHKKKGDPDCMIKNKDQVRHFFYRTWHKISKYIDHTEGVNKQTQELYGLINYWELKKKVGGRLDEKSGQKLNELIHKGATTIKVRGKNHRLKTPQCRALKRINNIDGPKEEEQTRLPERVVVELQPYDNAAWAEVQSMSQNPRVRMHLKLHHHLSDVIEFLQKKWKSHRIKQKEDMKVYDEKPQFLKLRIPQKTALNVYSVKSVTTQQKVDLGLQHLKENMKANEASISPPGRKNAKNNANKRSKENSTKDTCPSAKVTDRITTPGAFSSLFNSIKDHAISGSDVSVSATSLTTLPGSSQKLPVTSDLCTSNQAVEGSSTKDQGGTNKKDHVKCEPKDTDSSVILNEDSCGSQNVSHPKLPEAGENELIRQQIKDGWTLQNAGKVTIAELYLTLGHPEKLVMEYEWCDVTETMDILKSNLTNMLRRLVHLANTEFTDVNKSRQVISTVSSNRCSCGALIQNGTPPSNKHSNTSRSPAVGRNRSPNTPKGGEKPGGTAAPKGQGQQTVVTVKKVGRRLSSQTPENENVSSSTVDKQEESVFRVPTVPPIAARSIAARMPGDVSQKDFMQQLNSLQRSDMFLPKKSTKKLNRKPIMVKRTLLPKTQVPARHMVALAMVTNASQVAQTASFMPVSSVEALSNQMNLGQAQVYRRLVQMPMGVTASSGVIKSSNLVTVPSLTAPVTLNPLTSVSGTSLLTQTPLAASSPLSAKTPTTLVNSMTISEALPVSSASSETASVTSTDPSAANNSLSVSLLNDVSLSDLPNSSGTNISQYLDLSMLGPEDSTDKLIDLALCNSNNSLSGFFDQSSNNKTGTSTQELIPDMQWCGGEEFSLSNLLAESPVKKDSNSNSHVMTVPPVPPPNILAESSRDSLMARCDVDTALQCMMNESSIDYVSKFSDLAAQMASIPDTPHKAEMSVQEVIRYPTEEPPVQGIPD